MKWNDGVRETHEGRHLFLRRMKAFLIDYPARDEWGNYADGRASAWCYGFARGLYFRDAELHMEEVRRRVAEGRRKYPGLLEAFEEYLNSPAMHSMAPQILPPRCVDPEDT